MLVFFAMLVMTYLTPLLADDYSYSFSYADRSLRIANVRDIFDSLKAHRLKMNGRVFSHALTMLFLLGPKMIFNIANSVNACVLLFLMSQFYNSKNQKRNFLLGLLSVFLVWEYMPVFGQVFLWLDGSLNYSWAVTVVLIYILPFYRAYIDREENKSKDKRIIQLIFVLFSFVAGGFSENSSCAAIFISVCLIILKVVKKQKIQNYLYISLASAFLGFSFMMTAPAEIGRAAQTDLIGIAKNIQNVFQFPQKELLPLYCLFAVLLTISVICHADKKKIISAVVLFLGSCVSVAVYIFAVYIAWRSLCATTILLILSCLILLAAIYEKGIIYPAPILAAVMGTLFAFSFVLGIGDIAVLYMESRDREKTIYEGVQLGEDPVKIHQYSSNTKYAACYALPDVYDDPAQWPNYDIAAYYGAGAVVGLPPIDVFGNGE